MKFLFFEEIKVKIKTINKLIILQIITAALISLWAMYYGVYGSYWQVNIFSVFFWSAIITAIVYLVLSTRKTIKIFSSQTWRLLPFKAKDLFAANIFSSLLSVFYYFIIETGLLFLVGLPLLEVNNVWSELQSGIGVYLAQPLLWQSIRIPDAILFILLLAFWIIFIYSFSLVVNLTGNIVSEQFSPKVTKIVGVIVKLSLMILAILVFINSLDSIMLWIQNVFTSGILLKNLLLNQVNYQPLVSSFILVLIVDVFLSGLSIFLLNRFSEAKA